MPFMTTWTRPEASSWGWQFSSVTRPWVAQRVWAMPLWAAGAAPFTRSRRAFSGPTARVVCAAPVLEQRQAGGVIAAVLQGLEPGHEDLLAGARSGVSDDAAHAS